MVWCFRHLLCSLDRIYRYIFGACLWPGLPDWIYPYNFAIPNALNMLGSDSCYLYTIWTRLSPSAKQYYVAPLVSYLLEEFRFDVSISCLSPTAKTVKLPCSSGLLQSSYQFLLSDLSTKFAKFSRFVRYIPSY
jgi:hypothetical protein